MRGRPGFATRQLDLGEIDLADAAFDLVVANHCLYYAPGVAATAVELRRILRPAGRLLAATNGAGHMRELTDLLASHGVKRWPIDYEAIHS